MLQKVLNTIETIIIKKQFKNERTCGDIKTKKAHEQD